MYNVESNMQKQSKLSSTNSIGIEKQDSKSWLFLLILGILGFIAGLSLILYSLLEPKEEAASLVFPKIPTAADSDGVYSPLTGNALGEGARVDAPTYCIQTPNGTDGARPQAGLNEAGVVFEAIAEAGITRFAAIYQNPQSAVIGPIRSLRLYYLEWDTPFDCTIVHAGGADDALAALSAGGYKDLTENYAYMYRGTRGSRLWNNLFTTSTNLGQFGADNGFNTSNVRGFSRMTPLESRQNLVDNQVSEKLVITKPTTANTSELAPKVTTMNFLFGNVPTYNVNYIYEPATNSYNRYYGDGTPHDIYACPAENLGEANPEDVCTLTQMSPSVVIAMIVPEQRAADGYHEDITAVGSGTAYIFQNGVAIEGTWSKSAREEQIKFQDATGAEIKLAPGQTFISAVPNYGGVEY